MFEIADVMLDKDEVAMALNIRLELPENESPSASVSAEDRVSNPQICVSKAHIGIIIQKVVKVLCCTGRRLFHVQKSRIVITIILRLQRSKFISPLQEYRYGRAVFPRHGVWPR